MKSNEIISFKNIHKSYFLGEHKIKALQNLNFSVNKESFTSIVGKSGIGLVAKEQKEMQKGDGFGLNMPSTSDIFDNYNGGGLIGRGLAMNLSFCQELKIEGCKEKKEKINNNPVDEDIADFFSEEKPNPIPTVSLLVEHHQKELQIS